MSGLELLLVYLWLRVQLYCYYRMR